eukprot:1875755-Rhodomonas_salina.1
MRAGKAPERGTGRGGEERERRRRRRGEAPERGAGRWALGASPAGSTRGREGGVSRTRLHAHVREETVHA